jgi:ABC-2 type transport system permease protein
VHKEWLQILRDPSSIVVAFLLPLLLLFLFGYGVSLDVKNQRLAIVLETQAPEAREFLASLEASRYFTPIPMTDRPSATQALRERRIAGLMIFADDFGSRLNRGMAAPVQLIVNGTDANTARIIAGNVQGAWMTWLAQRAATNRSSVPPGIGIEPRVWFNESLDSQKSIVPGLIAVIMTLIGSLLTALVVAREWERGTMEALLTTPLTRTELLLGKLIPYFLMGMGGMALSVAAAILLFGVPFRGSFLVLLFSAGLFMLVVQGLGLLISTVTRNQFAAAIAGIVVTMLPTVLLSGLIFDIHSMPAVIQAATYIIPARYFVDTLKTLFLAGNIWPVILPNLAALAVMAIVLLGLTALKTRRSLE